MARPIPTTGPTARGNRTARRAMLLVAAFAISAVPGCGGCRSGPIQGPTEREREKPKDDFEFERLLTLPSSIERVESMAKPGHWTAATLEIVANNFDFAGELTTDPLELEGMPYDLTTARPAILPKGQRKWLEIALFLPVGEGRQADVRTRLRGRGGRGEMYYGSYPTTRMPRHQYHLFVMAAVPEAYTRLTYCNSVTPIVDDFVDPARQAYYRVMAPPIEDRTPLPSTALFWTSIAYVIWDGLAPEVLTPEQQQAMLDWLHWGGQLIISGPETLTLLRGSFLDGYLPVDGGDTREIVQADLAELNERWTIDGVDRDGTAYKGQPMEVRTAWSGQHLKPREGSQTLAGTTDDPLLVEAQVGRGRIVVTGFRLGQYALTKWDGFDNFFNGCLLRRPTRRFKPSTNTGGATVVWANGPADRLDPTAITQVRYFSRDTVPSYWRRLREDQDPNRIDPFDEAAHTIYPGAAGWDDDNLVAQHARGELREAAGIEIPDATFVLRVLGIYLLVIVPVNWGIFRALGRVEWAWIATPAIAVFFAVVVVRMAQLDIGFVRARTELGVIELHGGYGRAHVTRYTALYTSLSSEYEVRFDDPSAVVQPFPVASEQGSIAAPATLTSRSTVHYRRDRDVRLSGFSVSSNSIGMLHSEHMHPLPGGIHLVNREDGRLEVVNDSGLSLADAGVVTVDRAAWIGTLEPGGTAVLEFRRRPTDGTAWPEHRFAREDAPAGGLRLDELLADAERMDDPREMRLVATNGDEIPGLSIAPASSQRRFANLVVAHLRFEPKPLPVPDVNGGPRPQLGNEPQTE